MADKRRERELVDMAADRLGWQIAHVVPRERPDFEIHLPDGTVVALEVARLADQVFAEGEPAVRRLRLDLEARLRALGHKLFVHMSFYEACTSLVRTSAERKAHVDGIVAAIESALPLPDAERITIGEETLEAEGARFVDSLLLGRRDELLISSGHHGFMAGQELLVQTLRSKDSKVVSYRTNVPQASHFWLLLVANAEVGGPFAGEAIKGGEYPTAFDRVFCLDLWEPVQAFEIPTTQSYGP